MTSRLKHGAHYHSQLWRRVYINYYFAKCYRFVIHIAVIHLRAGVVQRSPTAGVVKRITTAWPSMIRAIVDRIGVDAFVLYELPDSWELAILACLEELELKLFGDFGHGWRSTY